MNNSHNKYQYMFLYFNFVTSFLNRSTLTETFHSRKIIPKYNNVIYYFLIFEQQLNTSEIFEEFVVLQL